MKNLRNFSASGGKKPEELLKSCGIEEDTLSMYSGMDEDALISELLKNVRASKENGSYNPQQMTAFINAMAPSLSPQQLEKLNNIVRLINGGAL